VAAEPIVTYSASGTLLERRGNRGPQGAPQGVYACRGDEQWVAVTVADDQAWRALCGALDEPAWARDPALARGTGRRLRHDDIDRELAAWFATRDRDEVVAHLVDAGVHAAPVWDQNRLDEQPQLAARGFTQWLEHPVAGPVPHPGIGLRSPQFRTDYRAPAPTVGQHTTDVLDARLGVGDDERAQLVADGVIGRV
jgi:crotonobetainyl-CoA:carnitine CoA-transferase CaiB-like acyl-CoA transferase